MLPVSVAITNFHSGVVGPQMNKFEQVSSVHHQMSLAEGGKVPKSEVWPGGLVPRSDVHGGNPTM